MKLKSLTDTFLITNAPSINEAEKFDRQILDYQYSLIEEVEEFGRHLPGHK